MEQGGLVPIHPTVSCLPEYPLCGNFEETPLVHARDTCYTKEVCILVISSKLLSAMLLSL